MSTWVCYAYTQARLERERGERAEALQTQKDEVERLRAAQAEREKALSEQQAKLHLIATAQPARPRAAAPPAPVASPPDHARPQPSNNSAGVDLSPVLAVIDADCWPRLCVSHTHTHTQTHIYTHTNTHTHIYTHTYLYIHTGDRRGGAPVGLDQHDTCWPSCY